MAKSKNSNRSANNLSIANKQLLQILSTPKPITTIRPDPIRAMALDQLDRRAWKPDISIRPPGAIQRKHARLQTNSQHKIRFAVPNKIAICVRRKQRKEILFAKRLTRKGAGSSQRRHNFWSSIKC